VNARMALSSALIGLPGAPGPCGAKYDAAAARCGRHGGAGHLMFPVANGVPLRYLPIATWALIATNAVVFLFEVSLSPSELNEFLYSFALVPARYFDSGMFDSSLSLTDYLPFVSNMFLHGGWLHLIVNMWTLWLFGRAVEDQLGSGRYLAFYFACGILASVTYAVLNPNSTVPALGASGAIAGILGCYMRFFPFSRIVVLIPILFIPLFFEVPAMLFAGLWFLFQTLGAVVDWSTPLASGGIAWWAHIGGFIAGVILAGPLRPPRRRQWPRDVDGGIPGFALSGIA
jgi:membrane associated rhomboid family serine protease